jgi:uncharacterized membrane protein YbhN (UPF0104 family)
MTPRYRALLRIVLSLGLLLVLLVWFDGREVLSRIAQMDWRWVVPALVLSVLQILLLAWRWRFTAARLGLRMPYRLALREYYLGAFLNQVLPGGILGDVSRAWRHARATARTRTAVHAVLLERIPVQTAMVAVALVSLAVLPLSWPQGGVSALGGLALILAIVALLGVFRERLRGLWSAARALAIDGRRAFQPGRTLFLQLASVALFVLGNLVAFVAVARALGSTLPLSTLLPLIAPVLLVMMLPVTVAGWGLREGAAALLWGLTGLSAAEGIAIAVAYGLVFFVAALPGAAPLLLGNLSVTVGPTLEAARDQVRRSTSNRRSSPSEK